MSLLRSFLLPLSAAALLGLTACGDDIQPTPGPDETGETGNGVDGFSHVTHTLNADGTRTTVVNASDRETWIGLDLDEAAQADANVDATWDLAFQRFQVKTRGGINGTGGVSGLVLKDVAFADLTQAPAEGYEEDAADGDDEGADPDTLFQRGEGWYSYDFATHQLTARDQVYVVKSDQGRYFKVRIESYYDDAGSPGMMRFVWGEITSPTGSAQQSLATETYTINATSSTEWVYLKVGTGIVAPATPATTGDWDVAFRRTNLRTNGGTSGSALGAARESETADFAANLTATTLGYTRDTETIPAGPPGATAVSFNGVLSNWYNYDFTTHVVTPKATTYLVRLADGGYAKLAIDSYASGTFGIRVARLEKTTPIKTLIVDGSTPDFAYANFADGVFTVSPTLPPTSWDLALRMAQIQTNSGTTNNAGIGGAVKLPAGTDFLTLAEVPADSYVVDTVLPASGAPGSTEQSGNSEMVAWFDYDLSTHTATPKAGDVYAVRTNDGGYVKLRIVGFELGSFTLEYAYSGAGSRTFTQVTP